MFPFRFDAVKLFSSAHQDDTTNLRPDLAQTNDASFCHFFCGHSSSILRQPTVFLRQSASTRRRLALR